MINSFIIPGEKKCISLPYFIAIPPSFTGYALLFQQNWCKTNENKPVVPQTQVYEPISVRKIAHCRNYEKSHTKRKRYYRIWDKWNWVKSNEAGWQAEDKAGLCLKGLLLWGLNWKVDPGSCFHRSYEVNLNVKYCMQKTIICIFAPGLKIDVATLYNNDLHTHVIVACFILSDMLANHSFWLYDFQVTKLFSD